MIPRLAVHPDGEIVQNIPVFGNATEGQLGGCVIAVLHGKVDRQTVRRDLGEKITAPETGKYDAAHRRQDGAFHRPGGVFGAVMIRKQVAGKGLALPAETQGNFNNELGLPLTVFRLRDGDEIAVLEMGISDFGEMTRLAQIARPDTCVITNIGTCHLENLGDRNGVLKAKTEIFKFLRPEGHIVLNGDDDKLITVKEYEKIKPVFFGMSNECQVYGDKIVSRGLKGMTCTIHLGDTAFTVDIPMPGRHMVYNALAAAAVGNIYGLTTEQIKAGIESLEPISGRFRMIETDKFLIVDDCYNANPMSMKASLDVLQDGAGRRIALLGDMGELGENEVQLHEEVGEHAGKCDIDVLICTGKLCRNMAERAQRTNPDLKVIYEPDRESLLEHLEGYVQDGDTILVKASHFMKFEEVVTKLENM